MSETTPHSAPERVPVGNLSDFIEPGRKIHIEVGFKDDGRVIVFHNQPFTVPVAWFEYDLTSARLTFVMDNGEIRDSGMQLHPQIGKNMQNSHQILLVHMNTETGQPVHGDFIPLVIHRKSG